MSQVRRSSRPAFRGRVRWIFLVSIALYALACIGCASFQRKLIYYPPVLTSEQVDELARAANVERWRSASGERIGWKRFSARQPAEGQLLILYGNGGCAVACAHYADVIQQAVSLDIFIVEYPGYADRHGSPSQSSLFRAADEALRLLATNKPTFLLGESLGTGVAAYLAGSYPDNIAGVVLLAPYNRLTDVAQHHALLLPARLLLVDRFPSQDYLRNYRGPVAMLVAGKDRVVPEKFGRRLYASYDGPKHLWEFPSGDHETVMIQPPEFWTQVMDFWRTNRR